MKLYHLLQRVSTYFTFQIHQKRYFPLFTLLRRFLFSRFPPMTGKTKTMKRAEPDPDPCFLGNPISDAEAMTKWLLRQRSSKARKIATVETPTEVKMGFFSLNFRCECVLLTSVYVSYSDNKEKLKAKHHYRQAMVDGFLFNLGDDVYVKAEAGKPNYIAKIVEFFQAIDGEPYFRPCWFYRPEDTDADPLLRRSILKQLRLQQLDPKTRKGREMVLYVPQFDSSREYNQATGGVKNLSHCSRTLDLWSNHGLLLKKLIRRELNTINLKPCE